MKGIFTDEIIDKLELYLAIRYVELFDDGGAWWPGPACEATRIYRFFAYALQYY